MKFVKTLIIITAIFAINACGFRPMHAPNAFGSGMNLQNISVKMTANEKIDFLLAQSLRDRMGDNEDSAYILSVEPKLKRSGLGVSGQDVASRFDLTMNVKFSLMDKNTGKIIFSDTARAVSTYGAPLDPYGSHTANENAKRQLAREAADRIITKIASYQAKQEK